MEEPENIESISEAFFRIAEKVPASEWARVQSDLSKSLDHYLYGSKKLTDMTRTLARARI